MITNQPIGMLVFPGSNCDADYVRIFKKHFQIKIKRIWYTDSSLHSCKGIIIPGGFSFGDYLRSGALAAMTPIITSLKQHIKKGGSVIGICNGFQILTESCILPGTLTTNTHGKFICTTTELNVLSGKSHYHKALLGSNLTLPLAHIQGRYLDSDDNILKLFNNQQVLLTYKNHHINGSSKNIAGITSTCGRVLGMMPHPERACCSQLNQGSSGLKIFAAFLALTI